MEHRHVPAAPEPPRVRHVTGVAPTVTAEDLERDSTFALARTLVDRMGLLAKKEIELALAEARLDKSRGVAIGAFAGASGIAMIASLCCGLIAAVLAIGLVFNPIWVALIGFALFGIVGLAFGAVGLAEGRELKPERTLRQARETAGMLREPVTP